MLCYAMLCYAVLIHAMQDKSLNAVDRKYNSMLPAADPPVDILLAPYASSYTPPESLPHSPRVRDRQTQSCEGNCNLLSC